MIISTDRNTFIRCFIYTFCIFILLYRPTQKSNINFKIVKKAIPFISLGIVAFFLLGKSKNYQSDFGNGPDWKRYSGITIKSRGYGCIIPQSKYSIWRGYQKEELAVSYRFRCKTSLCCLWSDKVTGNHAEYYQYYNWFSIL